MEDSDDSENDSDFNLSEYEESSDEYANDEDFQIVKKKCN